MLCCAPSLGTARSLQRRDAQKSNSAQRRVSSRRATPATASSSYYGVSGEGAFVLSCCVTPDTVKLWKSCQVLPVNARESFVACTLTCSLHTRVISPLPSPADGTWFPQQADGFQKMLRAAKGFRDVVQAGTPALREAAKPIAPEEIGSSAIQARYARTQK